MNISPVVLFVYNRPWHTQQTVEALQKNELAQESELFVFSDGAKDEHDALKVREVRNYLRTVDGFKDISIIEQEKNRGLAASIVDGVTRVVNEYGRVIVLEDDLITSPFFLKFMNEALEIYNDANKVMHVSGYMLPIETTGLNQTVFYPSPSCWGWATWERAWKHYERDPSEVIKEFTPKMIKRFNLDGSYGFWEQVLDNYSGRIKSWAIFWYVAVFKQNGLCLHPVESMVQNIGHDGSGVHCNKTNSFFISPAQHPVTFFESKIEENQILIERLKGYYRAIKPSLWQKIARKVKRFYRIVRVISV